MELRTPKRYRPGKRRRRIIGSWRWLRNLILLVVFSAIGYWILTHRITFRSWVDDAREVANARVDDLEQRIPVQPTPTMDVSNELVAANTSYQTGDFRRAIENYRIVIEGDPNNLEAHSRLALLLIITSDLGENEEQLNEALEVAERAINADPEAPDGWAIKSMALLWSGQFGPAIANALQALEINPNYMQAEAFLAEAYWRLDRDDLAVPAITQAVENLRAAGAASPETIATVFRTQGYIAERQLDRETAIQAYEIAREAAPTHSYIALELALSYFGAGQTDEAIGLLNQALDGNPRDTALMFQLGKIYVNIGDGEEGQQVFQRCVEADPEFPGCLSWLGGLQFFAGNYPQAITNLERAIDNGSQDPEDWWQLGRSHTFMLRCDLAVPVLREGYQRVEGNVDLEARFATGLRDCGAEVVENSVLSAPPATLLPEDVTPSEFFTATPTP